jgi:hypothetical protein
MALTRQGAVQDALLAGLGALEPVWDRRPCGAGGIADAYVCRLLPLTCMVPDIVEAILDGRQPKGLKLGNGPVGWRQQRTSGFRESA